MLAVARLRVWAWMTLVSLIGCGSVRRPPAVASKPATAAAGAEQSVLRAAEVLPESTLAVVVAPKLERFVAGLDLRATLGPPYHRLAYELVRSTGYNLLSARAWRDIGLAASDPAGVAVVGHSDGNFAVAFATVADQDRARAALYRWAAGTLTGKRLAPPEAVGDALLVDGDSVAALLTAGRLFVVFAGRGAAARARWLRAHPLQGVLSDRRTVRPILHTLPADCSLCGFIDVRAAGFLWAGLDPRWAAADQSGALARLAHAHRRALSRGRAGQASVSTLVAIDDSFDNARADLMRHQPPAALRRLLGPIEGAAVSLRLREKGVRLTAHLAMADDAVWMRVLGADPEALAVSATAPASPTLSLRLALEPAVLPDLFGWLGTPAEAASQTLGIDVRRELVPVLDGRLSVALAPRCRRLDCLARIDNLQAQVRLGVRDAVSAKRLLSRLAANDVAGLFVARAKRGEWLLTLPDLEPIGMVLRSGALLASSDRRWLAPPPAGARAAHRAHPHRGHRGKRWPAVTLSLSLAEPIRAVVSKDYLKGDTQRPSSPERPADSTSASPELGGEIERIDADLDAARHRAQAAAHRGLMKLAADAGQLEFRLGKGRGGVDMQLRHCTTRRYMAVLADAFRWVALGRDQAVDEDAEEELEGLLQRRQQIEQQLRELRPPSPDTAGSAGGGR